MAPSTYRALLQAVASAEEEREQQQQQQQQLNAAASPEQRLAAVQQRFLDRWLSVASVMLLEGARWVARARAGWGTLRAGFH